MPLDQPHENVTLHVRDLTRAYGEHVVVAGISFDIAPGRILALLGRNGCGKSTTMKVLAGAIPASSGSFTVCGERGSREAAQRRIGYVPDTRGLFPRLTGFEHLELAARLAGMREWRGRARDLAAELEVHDVGDVPVAAYSHGQARRLSMAMALLPKPPLLLIDEPFDGVDPAGIDVIVGLLLRAAGDGAAILLTTHIMEAASHAHEIAMFAAGALIGPMETELLVAQYGDLRSAWLALCEPTTS